MTANERRQEIVRLLLSGGVALSAAKLAGGFGVSRQTIVQDISVLREEGKEILSTPRGYVLDDTLRVQKVFKLFHEEGQVEDELSRIVEAGGRVESLFVYHRVYGKIEVPLLIEDRTHIADYIHALSGNSRPLAAVTGGYHYHLVTADSAQTIERIETALKEGGYLAE